jgi:cyclase
MATNLTRRNFLSTALAGAAGLSLYGGAARAGAKQTITLTRLHDNLLAFEGAGGNVVAFDSPEGVLMIDGGLPERSAELLKLVGKECGGRPVRTLLNTHWHWDHTGSNERLAQAGARVIAHENTKLWLGAEIVSKWEQRTYPPRPPRALPTRTFFYGSEKLAFGKQDIEYGLLPQAHTDGDIYVFFPAQNVLIAGDVVSGGGYPLLDYCTGGWIGGMTAGLRALLKKVDAATRIVPGAGPLRSKANLEAQLEMCLAVTAKIGESYYKGHTWDEFLAGRPTRDFDAQWGDPALFLQTAYEGAWVHVNEIRRSGR